MFHQVFDALVTPNGPTQIAGLDPAWLTFQAILLEFWAFSFLLVCVPLDLTDA